MKSSLRLITMGLLAVTMAFFSLSVFGQSSTTGSIEGQVVDQAGAKVPGVTITVSSSNLIRPQSAQSNGDGHYQILNLPPGRYTVAVAATGGFGEFSRSEVEVNLSKTSTFDVTLQPKGTTADVNITDTSGATVDVNSNTTGTTVSSDQFSNFPTTRTVQGLYTIAPTVTRSGLRDASGRERDPSVGGSSGPENNYILDGVNTTDPAFGGAGANLPFEFVQEVEVKTGAYGAEYGKATGGIFNVITKSGGNEFHGDLFGYFTTQGLVRSVKNLPFTGSAADGFSEEDLGGDIGGPIIKNKLWFFGAFNPQIRKNYYLTQTFHSTVSNKVTTPFYAGKLTYSLNQNNTLTFSTFGDFTKVNGFLATGALTNVSGFGTDPTAFIGRQETGGHNYALRLNSTISPTMTLEVSGGLHFQRANTFPAATDTPGTTDAFAIQGASGSVVPVTTTGLLFTNPNPISVSVPGGNPVVYTGQSANTIGYLDFAYAPGTLQRNFVRGSGFGLFGPQTRDRYEVAARFTNIAGRHTLKYGVELFQNKYDIDQTSSGPAATFNLPATSVGVVPTPTLSGGTGNNQVNGYRVTNSFTVCAVVTGVVNCPTANGARAAAQLFAAGKLPSSITGANPAATTITADQANNSPFLIRSATRIRDFELVAKTHTNVESFYFQDDYKVLTNLQLNLGLRWDYQQAYGNGGTEYIALNSFMHNMQPRVGFVWDPSGKGKGKIFMNYARFVETPIPLDTNVRAGGGDTQIDKNFNVSTYSGSGAGSTYIVPGIRGATATSLIGAVNLGASATPVDAGLRPQTVNEYTGGFEYEVVKDLALGARGIYRSQGSVIEDGSFNDGDDYFLFNPGERYTVNGQDSTEINACKQPSGCFGRARRYYRAVEFTATKRFSKNYQFIASYVYSSLIGNYEGLFRNDNGQSDPNITSLFDLVSLLTNQYGRLPNDRPHQFKFNGSYQTPWKLVVSGNFYAQSGVPFNQLIPHPVYGNNEGFGLPRGTAIIPNTGATVVNGSAGVESAVGKTRSPFTSNLDLGAYYPIKFGETKQLRFQFDWFNVFNQQKAVTLDQTFTINSGVTGVPAIPNPFYGSGLIFQFPSSVRLGVKFQF